MAHKIYKLYVINDGTRKQLLDIYSSYKAAKEMMMHFIKNCPIWVTKIIIESVEITKNGQTNYEWPTEWNRY